MIVDRIYAVLVLSGFGLEGQAYINLPLQISYHLTF